MLMLVDGQLAPLTEAFTAPGEWAFERLFPCMDMQMLAVILLGGKHFFACGTLEGVKARMRKLHVSSDVVL